MNGKDLVDGILFMVFVFLCYVVLSMIAID